MNGWEACATTAKNCPASLLRQSRVPMCSKSSLRFSAVQTSVSQASNTRPVLSVRLAFWFLATALAVAQAWFSRFLVSADSISYLDMSDGVMPGGDFHRLINGTWSPLYPFLLGIFRRAFHVSPVQEIVAAHFFNVTLFLFALACFEKFAIAMTRMSVAGSATSPWPANRHSWVYWSTLYCIFLWASLSMISLNALRPDMLLSAFVYLAVAELCSMVGKTPSWRHYLLLGMIAGVGFLVKAPMLPIALVILAISVVVVRERRPAPKMALASLCVTLLIASIYFVPLSFSRGRLTLEESGLFNYLVHVDRAGPGWYLENAGAGEGTFLHSPRLLFSSPPAYEFGERKLVTHPLRFDPAEWMAGVRPRFIFRGEVREMRINLTVFARTLHPLFRPLLCLALLAALGSWSAIRSRAMQLWPVLLVAVAGVAMYVLVHLEPRYIGAFVVLFGCAVAASILQSTLTSARVASIAMALLALTMAMAGFAQAINFGHPVILCNNQDGIAAAQLHSWGLQPGDRVARVSGTVGDLGLERIARVEIVSEVDNTKTSQFWAAPVQVQNEILSLLRSAGAKVVIATAPTLTLQNKTQWTRLANTRYWLWTAGAMANNSRNIHRLVNSPPTTRDGDRRRLSQPQPGVRSESQPLRTALVRTVSGRGSAW